MATAILIYFYTAITILALAWGWEGIRLIRLHIQKRKG